MATQRKKDQAQVAAGGAAGGAAGAAHKKPILSPVKLYKHDMKKQRKAVTWGPQGKPEIGCSGTPCFKHKNLDWSLHRLTPATIERSKPGAMRRKAVGRVVKSLDGGYAGQTRPGTHLKVSSPRWGEGRAPSRHERKVVPLPKKGTVEMGRSTKVAAGVVVGTAAVAGVHAVRDRGKRRH